MQTETFTATLTVNVNVNKDGENAHLFGSDSEGQALAEAVADFLEGADVLGGEVTLNI